MIVKFRADSALLRKQALSAAGPQTLQAAALGQRIGIALTAGRGLTDRSHVVFGRGLSSKQLAARIAAESDVEYAVADERKHIVAVPNDPFYATRPAVGVTSGGPAVGQWYLKPPGAAGTARQHRAGGDQRRAGVGHHHGQRRASSSPISTPACASITPTCRAATSLPGYDMVSPDDGASGSNFTSAGDGNGRDADASDPGDGLTANDVATNPIFASCTAGRQQLARHADRRPDRRGDQQRRRHRQRRPQRPRDAGARARQVRRLRLRHPGRHAVGRGHPGAGRPRQPDAGARPQHEPGRHAGLQPGLHRRHRPGQRGRRGGRRRGRQQRRQRGRQPGELRRRDRGRRPAPRRRQGRLLRPRPARSRSARRPATASTPATASHASTRS